MSALLEVLSVTYYADKGGAPCGTISVFDGKRGQIIHRRDETASQEKEKPPNHSDDQSEKGHKLRLTGPYRAISADGCVVIEIDLHHHYKDKLLGQSIDATPSFPKTYQSKDTTSSHVAELLIDIYNERTKFDVPVTTVVKACTCKESPSAEVTYALLSDAVEANIEVKLRQQDKFSLHKITACSHVGEVMLFEFNNKNTHNDYSQGPMIIPLARSVLAVPLESTLQIKVYSSAKVVEDFIMCNPDLESVHYHVGKNGKVEVKITYSD